MRVVRRVRTCLVVCVAATMAMSGCVSPLLISEPERAQLGTVAVAFAGDAPEPDFAGTRGRDTGAAKGAVVGAAAGYLRGLPFTLIPPIGVLFATIGGTAGAVGGAIGSTPEAKVRDVEWAIDAGGASALPQRLAQRVRRKAQDSGRALRVFRVPAKATAAPNPAYRELLDRDIDSILEIGDVRLVIRPLKQGPKDPEFALELSARIRVIRAAERRIVHDARVSAWSAPHKAAEWQSQDGQEVRLEFDQMVDLLATNVMGSVFLEYRT